MTRLVKAAANRLLEVTDPAHLARPTRADRS